MSNTVKWFHSGMAGAPVLSGTAGAMLGVLDACLVNGFNLQTLTSLAVASNVATATKASHGYVVGQLVEIAGATPAGLNGLQRVTGLGANTFTFTTSGISDQTATGTITAKTPSAGWEKAFSGTNKAAYRSLNSASNKPVLRLDDAGTTSARVVGYEAMTDVDTGTGPFPTEAVFPGGGYFKKSSTANATARAWVIVADDRMFFLFTDRTDYCGSYCFGEFPSEKPGDAFASVLMVANAAAMSNAAVPHIGGATSASSYFSYTPRSYTGIGGVVSLGGPLGRLVGMSNYEYAGTSNATYATAFPSPISNKFYLFHTLLMEGENIRCARFPGLYYTPSAMPGAHLEIHDGDSDSPLAGRLVLGVGNLIMQTECRQFFDITGPWR